MKTCVSVDCFLICAIFLLAPQPAAPGSESRTAVSPTAASPTAASPAPRPAGAAEELCEGGLPAGQLGRMRPNGY